MLLTTGSRLGPYEVLAAIGVGGMGEVYRARDTKLGRDVALKVLPAEFALDPERLARFKREAQVLAALNHPHVAAIYGLEEGAAEGVSGGSGTVEALVLEFIDGPTLADRIAEGPIALEEALPIARQMAEALEAAHEQGIVHRDLKPANIKVRPDGTVKVLDFGLAKLIEPGVGLESGVDRNRAQTLSPTITTPAGTLAGVILGTAAYMSPEQAKGRPADKRSDLWAFGCVLYEMLAGRRAFEGEDVSDTLAFVLTRPVQWNALPPATPRAIRTLLRRCLERDRKRRLADAADARLEIEEAIATPEDDRAAAGFGASGPGTLVRSLLIGASALMLGGLIVGIAMWNRQPPSSPPTVMRFPIPLAEGQRFTESGNGVVAISRDGNSVVFSADRRLYLRSMNDLEAKPISGTEVPLGQLSSPVFSPDGQSIAFVAGRPPSIKRIAVTGGAAVPICEGCGALGNMSWDSQGIVFVQAGQGLPLGFAGERARTGPHRFMRVTPDGGEPQLLFNVPDGLPWDAQVLPGGDAVLFRLIRGAVDFTNAKIETDSEIYVQSLKSGRPEGQPRLVIPNGSGARYLPTGHIVYARQGVLFARRFDLKRLEAVGEEVSVVDGVRRASFVGGSAPVPYFDVSDSGSLVYVAGPPTAAVQYDLGLLDPRTGVQPLKLAPNAYEFPRVSPDGTRIAVGTNDGRSENIWIYDRSGANLRQLTSVGRNRDPVWSADSLSVTFQSDREGDLGIWRQRADGSGNADHLTKPDAGTRHVPDSWSLDTLLFEVIKDSTRTLWALSASDGKISRVGDIQGRFALDATFSPDGRRLAYRSVIDGASGVTIEPFPATGSKCPIGNGLHPVFSRDGKNLFFRRLTTGEFFAAAVTTESGCASFGTPRELPKTFAERQSNSGRRNHDITPDGKFIGVVAAGQVELNARLQINVVLNWFEELKQRLPIQPGR